MAAGRERTRGGVLGGNGVQGFWQRSSGGTPSWERLGAIAITLLSQIYEGCFRKEMFQSAVPAKHVHHPDRHLFTAS